MNMDSVKSALLMEIFNSLSANNTDEKILDFADVPQGWHFGEGDSISAGAIRDAAKLHEAFLLNGFYETDAFPGLAGEVRVTAYHKNQYFEFTREINGEWSFIYELDGAIEEELDCLTMAQAQEIIKNASINIWNTSDIFQDNIGIPGGEDSKALLFDPRATAGFRWWNGLAPHCKGLYASTSGYFIPTLENLQSFGHSRMRYYQTPPQSSKSQAIRMTNVIETSPVFPEKNQRTYSRHSVLNPMISKSVWETNQDHSALQTSLPLDLV
jgi:hypothetical protein